MRTATLIFIGLLTVGSIVFTISGYGNKQTIRTKVLEKERIT